MAKPFDNYNPSGEPEIIHSAGDLSSPPELRILHYNDVYHVDASSAEPVGGIARFQTVVNHYRNDEKYKNQAELLICFSGDAFNPSLESSVTKGSHMVPVLNDIGTDVACVGNHDLDFGVTQFRHLSEQCKFPWLLSNVLDPALGENVPLGNAKQSLLLESSNGIKIGVIGLVEREWLDTINSLPPNLIYKSAHKTTEELVPGLRKQGAEIVIVVAHQREPNDNKVARMVPKGLVDIILGGHDHNYAHSIVNGCHVLRSGTDFKQLSYIEARRSKEKTGGWDLHIVRRDIVSSIPEDTKAKEMTEKMTNALKAKLDKPIGHSLAPLDARFVVVRRQESNMGNFVCDLMRTYYAGDCCIIAAGTIRGDQIYPPGVLRIKDILNCFPFEDPCVVIEAPGQAILDALENSVSTYPALEGRFPQVSNITFTFDPNLPPDHRIPNPTSNIRIGGQPLILDRKYKLVTRDYMTRGKDGFDALLVKSAGGELKEIVSEENGILISMLLRQYFMSLKTLGKWSKLGKNTSRYFERVHKELHKSHPVVEPMLKTPSVTDSPSNHSIPTRPVIKKTRPVKQSEEEAKFLDYSDDEEYTVEPGADVEEVRRQERKLRIMRQVMQKWRRLARVPTPQSCDNIAVEEFEVDWTRAIAPRIEGRIKIIGVDA
ncbi:hypothetical protein LTR64_005932 [Lithohypha guttulata]|uniref:uncharacterized protein n=1 Tax=Lithohypha guttulata TaxID=1690604 RepID=UPI002DDE2FC3|nr:hypothetical protein LTR51_002271 [Lithohypha guttulata]